MLKKLFLLFLTTFIAISFISCGGDEKEAETKDEFIEITPKVITKTLKERVNHWLSRTYSIDDWKRGECTVSFNLSVDDVVGTGTVSSNGTLTLNLNSKIKTDLMAQLHLLIEGVTATPSDVNWTIPENMRSIVIYCGDDILGEELKIGELDMESETLEPKNSHIWSIFDRDATITGYSTREEKTYSITAKKGWNIIKEDSENSSYNSISDFSTDTVFYINTVETN